MNPRKVHGLVRAPSRQLVRRIGYEWFPSSGSRWLGRFSLPAAVAVDSADRRLVWVDIEKMVHQYGFSFQKEGWHPNAATLAQYVLDPDASYRQSALKRFRERFNPSTVQELLLDAEQEPIKPLHRWPSRPPFNNPWKLDKGAARRAARHISGPPVPFRAPTPPDGLAKDQPEAFLRLLDTIRVDGYRPSVFDDQPLLGYFLVSGEDYRFVYANGNHRLAVLAHLGHRRAAVRLRDDHPGVVHREQLHRWTIRFGGVYPDDVAALLFDTMFAETGARKADAWGLR